MKTQTKVILGGIAALAVYGVAYVANRKKRALEIANSIKITPRSVKNIKVDWQSGILTAKIDLQMRNMTEKNVGISSDGIALKKIMFYKQTQYLGEVVINRSGISIPAFEAVMLKDIPIQVELGNLVSQLAQSLFNGNLDTVLDMVYVLNIFGQDYRIDYRYQHGMQGASSINLTKTV